MSNPGTPTLEQLLVFTTVVECGSFSAAARRLNRTQSVISYTIARLEGQLGLRLFERGTRSPTLTVSGQAVLGDARRAGFVIDQLRARAKGLVEGLEAQVTLAVDVLAPREFLVQVCSDFARAFPTVSLDIRVEAIDSVVKFVLDRTCVLALAGPILHLPDVIDRRHCGVVQLLTVVAASHPLAISGPDTSTALLREHTQLVLTDRTNQAQATGFAAYSVQTWRVSDLSLMHALLLDGLGWAAMPEPLIAEDLKAGRLKRLASSGPAEWPYPLDLIRRIDTPPRPASQWLADRLTAAIS